MKKNHLALIIALTLVCGLLFTTGCVQPPAAADALGGTADALRSLDHEILCVWGREDRWHPASGSVYFQGVLQNGRYYMIRNTGHLVQEENPGKLLEVVFSYIPPASPSYEAYTYTDRSGRGE